MELRSSQARSMFKYLVVLQEDSSHHEIQDYERRGEVPFFILTYLITYLHTYLLHGAESFLRS